MSSAERGGTDMSGDFARKWTRLEIADHGKNNLYFHSSLPLIAQIAFWGCSVGSVKHPSLLPGCP